MNKKIFIVLFAITISNVFYSSVNSKGLTILDQGNFTKV